MDELKKTSPHVILKILVEIWNIFSSFFYLLYLKATVLTSVAAIKKLESQHFRFLKYFLQFHVLRLHVKFCHTRSDFHCKQLLQFEGSETCQHINHLQHLPQNLILICYFFWFYPAPFAYSPVSYNSFSF